MLPKTLRKLALPLSFACLAVIATLALSSCNFFNSKNKKACTGSFNVIGDWTLNLGGTTGPGVIDTSGVALFFQAQNGTSPAGTTVLLPAITGTCAFSGTATVWAPPAGLGQTGSSAVTGNVISATQISGTIGSNNTQFSLAPNAALTGAPTALTATMGAQIQDAPTADILTVQLAPATGGNPASMTLTGKDNFNCTVDGTFTQEGSSSADLNIFSVSITFSGTTCPIPGPLIGFGFESSTDYFGFTGTTQLTGTYLYAMSSSSAAVLEVYPLPAGR